MKLTTVTVWLSSVVLAVVTPSLLAATPVTIHNPWLVNDRVADTHNITTMGATYINSYTPSGVVAPADDEAKAINIYNNQKRRLYHWADEPPSVGGNGISDPTYTQNVFGWCLCGRHADQGCTINNAAGLGQRKIGLPGHWVYEVRYGDGTYHLYDTMTTMYVFNKANPRKVASCAEIKADASLLASAVADGRACPGFLLCGDTTDWFQTAMNSWSDNGSSVITTKWTGAMDLRSGQAYKRTWESWLNQHPPIGGGGTPPYHHEASRDYQDSVNYWYWEPYRLTPAQSSAVNVSYNPTFRRWANGTDTLAPDFRSAGYQALLETGSTGVSTYYQDSITPDLHGATINVQGEAIFKISVPYYITDANFSGTFVKATSSDVCKVYFSSNGTAWTQVYDAPVGTTTVTNQNLRTNVFALWSTWYIKVQVKGVAALANAGVSNFVVTTTFEHNKGAMAYLDKGVNHVTLTFDNPAELVASGNVVKVTYKWKEYGTSDWTVDKAYIKYINTSPAAFTVVTGGTKVPRTEYIQMEVVPTPAPDVTAPSAVTNLACGTAGRTTMPLTWTAPGNDGAIGEAAGYDIRYSTSAIDESNFAAAAQAANVPVPQAAGGAESFTVTGLATGTTYYFAIKAFD
jgi:hypothetical protein